MTPETKSWLAQAGYSENKISNSFVNVLLTLVSQNKKNVLKYVLRFVSLDKIEKHTKKDVFIQACSTDDEEMVKIILESSFKNSSRINSDFSPLCVACAEENLKMVQLLLSFPGIDVNQKDFLTQTPLGIACQKKNLKMVKLLLDHPNIDVNAGTPIDSLISELGALRTNDSTIIQIVKSLLLSGKIDLSIKNSIQPTLWRLVVGFKNLELARLFLATPGIHAQIQLSSAVSQFNYDAVESKKGWREVIELAKLMQEEKRWKDELLLDYLNDKCREGVIGASEWLDWRLQLRRSSPPWLFAQMVYLSDDFLTIHETATNNQNLLKARRFFSIVRKFPMELQTGIAHKCFKSNRSMISSRESEVFFRGLARNFIQN